MRYLNGSLLVLVLCAICGSAYLNWRSHAETQRTIAELAATLAQQKNEEQQEFRATKNDAPQKAVPPELAQSVRREWTIEAPDMVSIEATLLDQKAKITTPLPEQPVTGAFLVRPDGSVNLGMWGRISLTGLTVKQASEAVRKHLARQLQNATDSNQILKVVVDVVAYNSKRYYVILDGDGAGEEVFAFPTTGVETVLDAIGSVHGLNDLAGKRKIWVARRMAGSGQPWQVLTVDWADIVQKGITATNYQLQPGDRLYVKKSVN